MGLLGPSKKDRTAMAVQLGWTYSDRDPFDTRRIAYGILPGGSPAGASHVIHGERGGGRIRLFDWIAEPANSQVPIEGFEGFRARSIKLTAAIADLPRRAPIVTLARSGGRRRLPVNEAGTGDARLDAVFVCLSRLTEANVALAGTPFAELLLDAPPDCEVELFDSELVVAGDRRPLEQLPRLVDYIVALREAVPDALYALAVPER
jgi:hypothetical protein